MKPLRSLGFFMVWVFLISQSSVTAPLPGQIMADPNNPAWFVYNKDDNGDGKLDPFYMCGVGGPEGFLYGDISNGFNQAQVINYLKQHGGNGIYMMAVRSHGGDGGSTQNPWIGNNPSNGLNQTVLNQWEQWFDALEAANITIFFLFYDDGVGYIGGSSFITDIVNKFEHHKNLIWCIAEEYGEALSSSQINSIASAIRAADDHDHPIANHQNNGTSFHFASTLDQFAYQITSSSVSSVHSNALNAWNNANGRYNCNSAEEHFTDNALVSDANLRKSIWATATAGSYFLQLGCWETKKSRKTPPIPQLNYMRYLYTFMESVPDLAEMAPMDNIVASGSAWALGKTGHYVLYLPGGGNVSVNLSGASGSLTAEWYNPRNGQKQGAGAVSGGGTRAFTAPDNNDWVLHIGGAPPDNTPPSTVQGLNAAAQGESQINLTWNAASDNESGISGYEIYRGTSANPTTLLATVGKVTTYQDNSCSESTTYYYRVKAINGAGQKSQNYSNEASATTSGDTQPPAIVSATAMGSATQVTVIFSEAVEKGSAETVSNFSINNGITVQGAQLQPDGKTVILTTTAHTEGSEYTLTVNGVTDASAAKNAIVANSTAAYTFIVELEISNISKAGYRAAIRNPNDSIYIDRDYRFSQFWPDYQQDHYLVILTANNEKSGTGTAFLSFDVNMNVEVRIGIAGGSPLSWMDGWTNTGQTVTAHTTFTLFSKTFPAGTVTLGGNEGSGSNMYTVFVTPDQGLPVIHVGNAESAVKGAVLNAVPNPFKPSTIFSFYLQKRQHASLKIFNPQGVLVAVLMDEKIVQGRQAVKWSGTGLNSGMYVAKLEAGSKVSIKKVMFLK